MTGRQSGPPAAARGRLASIRAIVPSKCRCLSAFARLRSRAAVLCLAGLGAAGCTPFDLVNALTPEDGYSVRRDLRYGDGARRTLDLYLPDDATADSPLVVFFYGGEWTSGAKADYAFVGEAFAARGFVTAIPDYRLYPQVRYPAFLEDGAAAVAWVRAHRPDATGRPRPVYLAGHSAGAYIVAMLTLDGRWLPPPDGSGCRAVIAAAALSGPYDFLPLTDPTLTQIFGPDDIPAATQPIAHVNGAAAPMFLASGAEDTTVRPGNSERLAARIARRGGRVDLRLYPDRGHIALVAALSRPFRGLAPVLDDMVAFFRRHPPAAACGAPPR